MRAEPGQGYERLVELIIGAKIAAALHVVVDKGLADVLARGPQTAEALAQAVQIPVETLRRFLRALTQVGLFAEVKGGVFTNTEVSEHLRSDGPYSLRDMVTVLDDEAVARGWRRLPDVLASGQPAFDAVNGMGFFDWIKSDPVCSAAMASFMGGIYGPQGPKIATGYRFLTERGLAARCEVFAGDFFETVPSGFDAYILKSCLHDWQDAKSVEILRHCRDAMPDHGRVLIVEIVLAPGRPIGHPHRLIDLEMMVTLGGKERSEQEFADLLAQAGLRLTAVTPIAGSFFSVVEALAS
jgi:hypothetical protein